MISADMFLMQKQVYNFLRSVTIKFSPIADDINNTVILKGYPVNQQDPSTWKYYINMIGSYHVSDTQMYVTSLDTRQKILFSPTNLTANPRTKEAYMPGGKYYDRLCVTYPSQVDLIKSILFPVSDIETALNSADFTLLSYASGYLEEWEQPLIIMKLEKFLKIYVDRWYFDFLDDEPYFHLTSWGWLWYSLATVIMTARMEFIRTPYVHSWHIWNELQANGIGNYSDILNRKQSMMLYQNIDYLKTNAGKQSNLIILANNLLSDFGIGLYGRKVVQESETAASTYELTPQLEAVKIPTNYGTLAAEIPPATVTTIQDELFQLGLTPSISAESIATITRKLGDTTLNDFATKFLEIRPIAKNTPYAQSMSNFFMETLVLCIAEGYYTNNIQITEPITNTILYLTPGEQLALLNYAIQKSINIDNDTIPTLFNLSESFTPTIGTSVNEFTQGNEKYVVSGFVNATEFFSGLSYNTNIQSPTDFTTMTSNMWLKYMEHQILDQDTILNRKRVILSYLSSLCHQPRQISLSLVPGFTSYSQWLGSNGIDVSSTIFDQYSSQADVAAAWQNLSLAIITALIPPNAVIEAFTDLTLSSDDYNRLTQLFINMCSYMVLFLQSSPYTPTFTIGSKWDTVYGPYIFDSFGNYDSGVTIRYYDNAIMNADLTLFPGISFGTTDITNQLATPQLTYTSSHSKDTMVQFAIKPKIIVPKSSTVMTSGSMNMPYNRMQTTMSNS